MVAKESESSCGPHPKDQPPPPTAHEPNPTVVIWSPLEPSGLHITTVGFGAWAVGGGGWSFGWGPQDEVDSLATMRHALEVGINWTDTAAAYGLGHSEEIVGRLLRGLPSSERPLVFTKCGLL